MSDGYITQCVECGRELEAFEGDICESCWALEYEPDDDYDDYDDEWHYDAYYEWDEPKSRWQRVKAWVKRLYWNMRYKLQPNLHLHDDIPF